MSVSGRDVACNVSTLRRLALLDAPEAPEGAVASGVRVSLQLSAADGADAYEVVAIDAGVGNGWHFSPSVIAASVPLWERVNCYLGHASDRDRGPNGERQPPDFCGVFSGGCFDADAAAIRGKLKLMGPAAAMARSVAEADLQAYQAGEPARTSGSRPSCT